jgi:hypothetical protein
MKLRPKDPSKVRGEMGEKLTWETLKDMLEAQNRSKWISKLEVNEALKNQILDNPGIVGQLPDDSQDIDKWIADRQREMGGIGAMQGLDLMRHFQSVNFNSRIFKLY